MQIKKIFAAGVLTLGFAALGAGTAHAAQTWDDGPLAAGENCDDHANNNDWTYNGTSVKGQPGVTYSCPVQSDGLPHFLITTPN